VQEQTQKVHKLECEIQILEHKRVEAERESASLREELHAVKSLNVATAADNCTAADDVDRLKDHIKKLQLQRDLAKQCSDNAEAKLTTLEGYCNTHFLPFSAHSTGSFPAMLAGDTFIETAYCCRLVVTG